jgi:hypothetical protein
MVTRILAPRRPAAGPPPEVLALLEQCLADGNEGIDAASTGLIRDRVDRLLAALTTAGVLLSVDPAERLSA